MKLIITRHGETIENINKICQDHIHGTLSENGIEQAKKLAERFSKEKIDIIYSSDLKRAEDTAKEIAKHHPETKLLTDKRIRERYMGEMQGKPFPKDINWENTPEYFETKEQLFQRTKEFIEEIYKKHKNETVLVVCHGGTKRAMLSLLHNLNSADLSKWKDLHNASVSEFELKEDGNHEIKLINCKKHLEKN